MALLRVCDIKNNCEANVRLAIVEVSAHGIGTKDVCYECLTDYVVNIGGRIGKDAEGEQKIVSVKKI